MKFARLFELENDEQVLITVTCDVDKETYNLTVTSIFGEISAGLDVEFNEREDAIKVMNDYTLEKAIAFRAKIDELITSKLNKDVDDV